MDTLSPAGTGYVTVLPSRRSARTTVIGKVRPRRRGTPIASIAPAMAPAVLRRKSRRAHIAHASGASASPGGGASRCAGGKREDIGIRFALGHVGERDAGYERRAPQ